MDSVSISIDLELVVADRLVRDFTRGVTCLSAGVSESRPQISAL